MPRVPRPHASIRTGDVVVLLRSPKDTEGEVIVTMSDGRYKVKWVTGLDYRDRITTVTDGEIRKKTYAPRVTLRMQTETSTSLLLTQAVLRDRGRLKDRCRRSRR
jgi:hypothetical protein